MLRAAVSRLGAGVRAHATHLWCSGPGKQQTPRAARAGGVAAPGRSVVDRRGYARSSSRATPRVARRRAYSGCPRPGDHAASPAPRRVRTLRPGRGAPYRPAPRPRLRARCSPPPSLLRRRACSGRAAGCAATRGPGCARAGRWRRTRRSRWRTGWPRPRSAPPGPSPLLGGVALVVGRPGAGASGRCSWSRRPGCWGSPGIGGALGDRAAARVDAPASGCAGTCAGCDLVAGCRPSAPVPDGAAESRPTTGAA